MWWGRRRSPELPVLDVEAVSPDASADRRLPRFIRDVFFLGTAMEFSWKYNRRRPWQWPKSPPQSAAGLTAGILWPLARDYPQASVAGCASPPYQPRSGLARTHAVFAWAARMRSSRLSASRTVPGPGLPAWRSKGLGSDTARRAASRGASCRTGFLK